MTWDEVDARLLQETLRVQDKPYRTRGNPSWVLKMVALVKPKRCCKCKCTHDVELHHEDGNWKNYRLYNLNWYCKQHHQEADNRILHLKEKHMKPRIKWTSAMVTKYTTFCSKNTENGKTLDWCYTNFSAGDGDATEKYGSRYFSNKAAYQKYVRLSSTKSKQTKKMKNTRNVKWTPASGNITRLQQEIHQRKEQGWTTTQIFQDISDNSEMIFGKHLAATHLQKRAYACKVAGSTSRRTTTRSVISPQVRAITLSQILEYRTIAEAAGYQFILR